MVRPGREEENPMRTYPNSRISQDTGSIMGATTDATVTIAQSASPLVATNATSSAKWNMSLRGR